MEVEGRVLDIVRRPAVVVNDRHPVAGVQQLPVLHQIRPVGVHHHQQGPRLGVDEGVGTADKYVLVLRQAGQLAHQGPGVVALQVDDDLGPLPPLPGRAAHARRRAHRVHVRVLVAHDVDLTGVGDELAQGLGHNPALYLGPLLCGLGPAAVELEVQAVLHHGLIAAPAQAHLDGLLRPAEGVLVAVAVPAHADGQGGADPVLADHLMDGLQYGELLLHDPLEELLVADEEIAVPVVLAQKAAGVGDPGVELLVHLGQHGALGGLAPGLEQLLIIVQHQDGDHSPAGLQDGLHVLALGDVHEVGGDDLALAGGPAPHAACGGVDLVGAAGKGGHVPGLVAVQDPLVIEVRGQIMDGHVKEAVLGVRQAHEAVVGPDDLPVVRPEDHHRQGRVEHAVFVDGVHAAGDGLNILHHAAPAAGGLPAVEEIEQDQRGQLRRPQQGLEGGRDRGEQDQTKKIGL